MRHEAEEETEETPDYGEGLPPCEQTGREAGGDRGARASGYIQARHP